jgi:hypothetical protein
LDSQTAFRETFFAALETAGLPKVPSGFSVVPSHQSVPTGALAQIGEFIEVFDAITTSDRWVSVALRVAPSIAQVRHGERCFFSAFDFHLPPEGGAQLIEFNDNGSGFLFAAMINALYFDAAGLGSDESLAAPLPLPSFTTLIADMVESEAMGFFGERPNGLLLILDDAESLARGKFRRELQVLCDLSRKKGWAAALGDPAETFWDGQNLLFKGDPVSFIVNRSTDFFWQSETCAALQKAYEAGTVYIAPNPFTYATRSDKRLLEWLSLADWDENLGISLGQRQILNAHVPETHLVRAQNAEMLAQAKRDFVFKPVHGFAGRGLLDSTAVGATRLRRILKQGESYVAQRRVAKPSINVEGTQLWTDLRVWSYRSEIFLLSGRASRVAERLDLTPPGGWLPTFAAA